MKDLWKGLAMLTVDEKLRKDVHDTARCVVKPDLPTMFQKQPNIDALRAIDQLFRQRGLVLSAYALAEINRWFADGGNPFLDELGHLRDAIGSSLAIGNSAHSPEFMEAIGVLVADPELLDNFIKGTMSLRQHGFRLSPQEEDALRSDFESGSSAAISAKEIHRLGWDGGSCSSRLLVYDKLFHLNQ